jgi:hypothetical protein
LRNLWRSDTAAIIEGNKKVEWGQRNSASTCGEPQGGLDNKVFFDDLFVLPDLYHGLFILDHPFFEDVAPVGSLSAEFEILVSQ